MRASFERSTHIAASPSDTWALLHDVDRLAECSSHLGPVTTIEPDRRWQTSLQDRVGPFRLAAPMEVELIKETAMEDISIRAWGRDRGPGTRLVVEATVSIEQAPNDSRLHLEGSYDLKGGVARIGAAVARRQAESMIDEFWTNLTTPLQPLD